MFWSVIGDMRVLFFTLIYALILSLIARRLFVYCRDASAELAARRLQDRSEAPIGLAFRRSQNERG